MICTFFGNKNTPQGAKEEVYMATQSGKRIIELS